MISRINNTLIKCTTYTIVISKIKWHLHTIVLIILYLLPELTDSVNFNIIKTIILNKVTIAKLNSNNNSSFYFNKYTYKNNQMELKLDYVDNKKIIQLIWLKIQTKVVKIKIF